jgi:phage shock protein E
MNIEKMILEGATVVDVRTVGEFMGGNAPGSVNIPLNEVVDRELELKEMKQPIVLCCASGNRSGQAVSYLSSNGFEKVYNGGGWMSVDSQKS